MADGPEKTAEEQQAQPHVDVAGTERAHVLYPNDKPAEVPGEKLHYPNDVPYKPDAETPSAPLTGEAPAAYTITPPEGFDASPEMLQEATPIFRELGLTNEGASRLLPLGAKLIESHETSKMDQFAELRAGWARTAKNDPELGKNWKETEGYIAAALNAGGAPRGSEFRNLLNESGIGDHPAAIRVFRRLGELLARLPRNPNQAAPTRAEALYPNDARKSSR